MFIGIVEVSVIRTVFGHDILRFVCSVVGKNLHIQAQMAVNYGDESHGRIRKNHLISTNPSISPDF